MIWKFLYRTWHPYCEPDYFPHGGAYRLELDTYNFQTISATPRKAGYVVCETMYLKMNAPFAVWYVAYACIILEWPYGIIALIT